jgi:hypothetical protein
MELLKAESLRADSSISPPRGIPIQSDRKPL